MASASVPGFVGPSNPLRAPNADVERTINLYLEPTAPGTSKVAGLLQATPGLVPMAQVMDSPGFTIFEQDGQCFGVIGSSFFELNPDWSTTVWGTVTTPTPTLPATIVSNGTAGGQLLICAGGDGFVYTLATNAFTILNDTTFPGTGFPYGQALMVEFMDGYGIVVQVDSRTFFISALEDFTSWDPLDVAQRSEGSDNLVGLIRNHRELWFPGTKTGEVWYDSGNALFPFAPVPGVFLDTGAASCSMCRIESGETNTIAWLSQDERGQGIIKIADGYSGQPISTIAVTRALQASTNLAAAKLFCQQQESHVYLWVLVPDLETTWVYDFLTGKWHERALWDPTACTFRPHLATASATFQNLSLVTSSANGSIYALSLTAYQDVIVT